MYMQNQHSFLIATQLFLLSVNPRHWSLIAIETCGMIYLVLHKHENLYYIQFFPFLFSLSEYIVLQQFLNRLTITRRWFRFICHSVTLILVLFVIQRLLQFVRIIPLPKDSIQKTCIASWRRWVVPRVEMIQVSDIQQDFVYLLIFGQEITFDS